MIIAEKIIDGIRYTKDTKRRCRRPGCYVIVIKDGEAYCKPCRWQGLNNEDHHENNDQ